MPLKRKEQTYFISAGEHSGDLLAADLVLSLKEHFPKLKPMGVVGTAMLDAGVAELASIRELSVMGVAEVARRLADLKQLETKLLTWVDRMEPAFAVLVDNPGFHLRLAEQLHMRGVKVFQYVAPKIWAWGAGRSQALREYFDLVLGILPFEEDFFRERQVPYTYVGSPLKDRIDKVLVSRAALGLPEDPPVIACLPGSRLSEVVLNLRTIFAVKPHIERKYPNTIFVVPVSDNLDLEKVAQSLKLPLQHEPQGSGVLASEAWVFNNIRFVRGMSLEIMAVADAALVASGTATLECALLGTPMAVIYTMNELTYQIARRAVKIPYVSLVNLMANERLVQEYIQDFSYEDVAAEIVSLMQDSPKRSAMCKAFQDMRLSLEGSAAVNAAKAMSEKLSVAKL